MDSILTPELVNSDVPLASEKGEVGIHLAEHAFALLLALTRGLHTAIRTPDYELREPIRVHQRELYEQTMGVVGFGGTGRAVARRAVGFGMRVLGVDIERIEPGARRGGDLARGPARGSPRGLRRGGDRPAAHQGHPPPLHPRALPPDETQRDPSST